MPEVLKIGEHRIQPGERKTIQLPLPFFYTHSPTPMPIHVIHGRRAGPSLLITSALHGDEINGVEIIRRLLGHTSIKNVKGSLILIPVVNVFGFIGQSRYLPDRRDLNRSFPGSPTGSMAARLTHLLMTQVLPASTHVIDLHTGAIARENLPQIRATIEKNAELEELTKAFNAPVILDSPVRPGTFRESAHNLGIPTLVYEAGEALRFDELSIRAGVAGVLNIMSYLEMIRKRKPRKDHPPLIAKSSSWCRAPQSGITRSIVALGAHVKAGDALAYISDPFGDHEEAVISPAAGIVIGRSRNPLIHEGEAIFHIAKFSKTAEAAEAVEIFQDAFDPETDTVESEEPPVVG